MGGQAFIAAAALVAALGAVQPAAAQQYRSYHDEHVATQQQCSTSRTNRTAGGAVIGGVLGALLGREVADRGNRGEGAALGAVVGAVAGGAVGRTTARCGQVEGSAYDPYYGRPYADQGYSQGPYNQGPYNQGQYNQGQYQEPYYGGDDYRGDDSGLYGGPYQESSYRGGRDCRPGEIVTRDPYGRTRREQVMMCRGRDGEWRPQY